MLCQGAAVDCMWLDWRCPSMEHTEGVVLKHDELSLVREEYKLTAGGGVFSRTFSGMVFARCGGKEASASQWHVLR